MITLSATFQQNMKDRFNAGMSCITEFVFLHAILRSSQMLLMMYNVSFVVVCAEVTYKGYFVIQ